MLDCAGLAPGGFLLPPNPHPIRRPLKLPWDLLVLITARTVEVEHKREHKIPLQHQCTGVQDEVWINSPANALILIKNIMHRKPYLPILLFKYLLRNVCVPQRQRLVEALGTPRIQVIIEIRRNGKAAVSGISNISRISVRKIFCVQAVLPGIFCFSETY